ncbi:WecB/TagA/CpsF family glycosyltransferase [Marinoscillum furvescens]|uniref:N-acetylglucosaminyldiphosphoundecaprenol N-acetyl-beta-D-mannosaminyltransferase n=1 Tax=Marinoscillum furvescens DSM 4134 TaxID=1122208 RepID=A0A3D9L623_MARFU|nr:WecB/TagA/CpsF family glycosyltransferase [Marinoscillum furvescens]REE01630.1 N-acetylglucosaminyldiphosphoundecaprenol N-acetyl-beta-D-mannosaminyltransferase [Marinoscillum furvescens DSM 4134]
MKSTEVLEIPLYVGSIDKIVPKLLAEVNNGRSRCVSASGAHGLVHSKKNSSFKSILRSFYTNLPDGMPGVWVGRLKGEIEMTRCYGPDFFMETMKASKSNVAHFLCGGQEGVADQLKDVCENMFGAKIVGTYCPPFQPVQEYDYEGIAEIINASQANFVWIGLSTPKQEEFAAYLSQYTNVDFVCCVGAAFDFHIGNVRQAPAWMQKNALEWFFRLLVEPRRLWKRYFKIVPLFIYYNFAELILKKLKR